MAQEVSSISLRKQRNVHPLGSRYEQAPPWLLSMILHLATVLALALVSIKSPIQSGLEITFVSDDYGDEVPELAADIAVEILGEQQMVPTPLEQLPLELSTKPVVELALATAPVTGIEVPSKLLQNLGGSVVGRSAQSYTSVFGLQGAGTKFAYVFDRSDSMTTAFAAYHNRTVVGQVTPLELAKEELLRSLDQLTEEQQFQIIFYNQAPLIFIENSESNGLLTATDENKDFARDFVVAIPGMGRTNHWGALEEALSLDPDVIFLLTDGEAKDDPRMFLVRRMSGYCRQRNIQINVVHFSDVNRPQCTLIDLAERTGGVHCFLSLQTLVNERLANQF